MWTVNVNIGKEMSNEGFLWSFAESGGVCICYSNNKDCCKNEVSID